jgi:hypothetical protein
MTRLRFPAYPAVLISGLVGGLGKWQWLVVWRERWRFSREGHERSLVGLTMIPRERLSYSQRKYRTATNAKTSV